MLFRVHRKASVWYNLSSSLESLVCWMYYICKCSSSVISLITINGGYAI